MKKIFKKARPEPAVQEEQSPGSFPDFTKKEIFTQGDSADRLLSKYIRADKICFDYLKIKPDRIKRIYLVGGKTDFACAVYGAYNFEILADVISSAMCSGEFICSNPILDRGTLAVIIGSNTQVCKRCAQCGAKVVQILDYGEGGDIISLDFKTMGEFDTVSYTLKMLALAMLALYIGEKGRVITSLYIKIATRMLTGLRDKIKVILSREYIINEAVQGINLDGVTAMGINVDYAVALYTAEILSAAGECDVYAAPYSQLSDRVKKSGGIIISASNAQLYDMLDSAASCALKILPEGLSGEVGGAFTYEESIPLLNPLLGSVVVQLIAYEKYCRRKRGGESGEHMPQIMPQD